jgi:hypothetical protein
MVFYKLECANESASAAGPCFSAAKTFRIMILSIKTFSIVILNINGLNCKITISKNDTQLKGHSA